MKTDATTRSILSYVQFLAIILLATVLAFFLASKSAHSVEISPGIYDFVGEYNPGKNIFTIYKGTEAQFNLYLLGGDKLFSEFLSAKKLYYKATIKVTQKLVNHDGIGELLAVKGITTYNHREIQFKKIADL